MNAPQNLRGRCADALPKVMFILSAAASIYGYGVLSHKYALFPFPQIRDAVASATTLLEPAEARQVLYRESPANAVEVALYLPDRVNDGLVLLMGTTEDQQNMLRVVDRYGTVVVDLELNWFSIWGKDEGNFPAERRPKSGPGALLHGVDVMNNGDFVVNFEHLSTLRVNPCGAVVWKLDNLGHHSVHIGDDDSIWVSSEVNPVLVSAETPAQAGTTRPWMLQQIAPDGRILQNIPVVELLQENDLEGLLRISALDNRETHVHGDTLHLNDVETFPHDLDAGIFEPGDIMVSLRNINTVIVLDPNTRKVKFRTTGEVVRQHDPDFISGDRISVFDNYNLLPTGGLDGQASRIVEFDARTGTKEVVIDQTRAPRFFTALMGTHQRLSNGNVLVNSSGEGRVMELLPNGTLAWEATNLLSSGRSGRLTGAMVLPSQFDAALFESRRAGCDTSNSSP